MAFLGSLLSSVAPKLISAGKNLVGSLVKGKPLGKSLLGAGKQLVNEFVSQEPKDRDERDERKDEKRRKYDDDKRLREDVMHLLEKARRKVKEIQDRATKDFSKVMLHSISTVIELVHELMETHAPDKRHSMRFHDILEELRKGLEQYMSDVEYDIKHETVHEVGSKRGRDKDEKKKKFKAAI